MKLTKTKGSNHALEAGFCCLHHKTNETHQAQRQQPRLGSKILLPPPLILMKLTKRKGSKLASKARICCLRHLSQETHQAQRQQPHLRIEILLPSRKLVIMTKKHGQRVQISNKMNDISPRCIYNEFVRGTRVPPAFRVCRRSFAAPTRQSEACSRCENRAGDSNCLIS